MENTKIKLSASSRAFYITGYIVVGFVALVCLLPFVIMVSGSFSSEQAIRFQGFGILPRDFTLQAYKTIFKTPMTVVRSWVF